MKNDTLKGQYRINEQIRAKEVRIVSDDIEPQVYPIFQALKMAEEKELDLVEISPNAQPPVCRIIDYSKFLYQLKKRQKEQKAKQVKVNVKEIRFGPQTDDHDYNQHVRNTLHFIVTNLTADFFITVIHNSTNIEFSQFRFHLFRILIEFLRNRQNSYLVRSQPQR